MLDDDDEREEIDDQELIEAEEHAKMQMMDQTDTLRALLMALDQEKKQGPQ